MNDVRNSKSLKSIYSSLAYCRLMAQRWRGHGVEKRAAHYDQRAAQLRREINRKRRKDYPPLIRCVVFYPEGEQWKGSVFWSSRPEASGVITQGMQSLIDHLLKRENQESKVWTIPTTIHQQTVGAYQ